MKVLAIEKNLKNIPENEKSKIYKNESKEVWKLYKNSRFREIYLDKSKQSAVIILECNDIEDAKVILKSLPMVKENFIEFDLIELSPFPGFELLFAEKE